MKPVPSGDQLAPQLLMVVAFAIKANDKVLVIRDDRLLTRLRINNAKPGRAQRYR